MLEKMITILSACLLLTTTGMRATSQDTIPCYAVYYVSDDGKTFSLVPEEKNPFGTAEGFKMSSMKGKCPADIRFDQLFPGPSIEDAHGRKYFIRYFPVKKKTTV